MNPRQRVVRAIPTAQQQMDEEFRRCDRWTRELAVELARLGYDVGDDETEDHVYLKNVGRDRMLLVLRVEPTGSGDDDSYARITRVVFGRESRTARQATLWLRKKASRERRYLR